MAESGEASDRRAGAQNETGPGAPSINLPKGGGAIRGIGEKFAANPVTGTGSTSVPIATSPGRSGFGPQLSLSYDSGAGNGPFGFGWSLSLPQITRKTEKGLPRYHDAVESDVFILSGAEDLVPVYRQDTDGTWVKDHPGYQRDPAAFWVRDASGHLLIHEDPIDGYRVRRYRPRIEGLFARIERWSTMDSPSDVHWRSISKDNILTLYGSDANSRIFDPEDPRRIFSWLICETRDDKGNAVLYRYKAEDGLGVDLGKANERNRGTSEDARRAANLYLKHIYYGNRSPLLDKSGHRPRFLDKTQIDAHIANAQWMFEAVFDYGEHDTDTPNPKDAGEWTYRSDPFSSYRGGFEVRTTRLCQRVLTFHHFPAEPDVGADCLVRSTDFTYSHEQNPASARNPVYTFLRAVIQTGYRRNNGSYDQRSLPPLDFKYTQPIVQDTVQEVDAASLENLPIGVDGAAYQWTDLHGEGIPGILTEQIDAWFYKRNISPISDRPVEFAPVERVAAKPNLALAGGAQFMDLAGDGQPDLAVLDGPTPGLYEHDDADGWQPFRPFTARLNRDMRDPNLKFVDLDGDGHADVLISEDDAFVWHASLAEAGFGPACRVLQARDEEKGPRLVFADGTQSIYLADLSGDGLTDLVRIRNGEVCYWPNLGYGRFGAKVTMDNAPYFDNPDQFDHKRIRLADIDGSGTTDIIYLHRDGVRLYFNQSGNGWSAPRQLNVFPRVDDLVSIVPTDLLGNGTACLVWSSPLPGDAGRQMRYVDLMGGQKPHLLIKTVNNLGAETVVHYASSTKFYLQDKRDGKPWITRLPFPVHVVERVETLDRISRNRFVTRYAYHHGYFDGEEREFRGFGLVEQWDTEELTALTGGGTLPPATNVDAASHVPPVLTRSWFHTGAYLEGAAISLHFAHEYYGAPLPDDPGYDAKFRSFTETLLPDTVLPPGLTLDEEREACRALKGSMLRQEVYALDGTSKAAHPYTVAEQNFSVRLEQPRAGNRHAVFLSHPREAITYHYERDPADPRVQHALTLEVDPFGNVLKSVAIGYGRHHPDASLALDDQKKQTKTLITYTENDVTNAIDAADAYRTPLPCEARTYELTGYPPTGAADRFQSSDFVKAAGNALTHVFDSKVDYENPPTTGRQRRLIEHVRTLYRSDHLTSLLPLRQVQPLALPGESYKLAFTPGLLANVFQRNGQPLLLPNPADVLGGQAADRGGYLPSQQLKADGRFPNTDPDDHWWIPAGRVLLSPSGDDPAVELAYAQSHFFLPHRYRNPFHTNAVSTESFVTYDVYDLLMVETRDALGNRATVGERRLNGTIDPTKPGNDYRVLQPRLVMDPNRNRAEVAFDTLGMVVGTAVMGKPEENLGDSLDESFTADLTEAVTLDHLANPLAAPKLILGRATTWLVYDLFAYQRTKKQPNPQPAVVYTLARETHDRPVSAGGLKIQHSFSYSDGFGREIQKKIQAEPGPLVKDGPTISPRWVGSGWTIFNNKGKPVRQYEPFFSATHHFEFGVQVGVSPILFYDPVERVVATLHPNHTWEKVVFDPWRQETYDVNDTVANKDGSSADPKNDPDVADFFRRLPDAEYLPTWHGLRTLPQHAAALAQHYPDAGDRTHEAAAAGKAAAHADTPTTAHFDALGRPFLTVVRNRVVCKDHALDGKPDEDFRTRVELDIEGNQREVRDERRLPVNGLPTGALEQRIVMRYDYDMLGNRIRQLSMEAGKRWMLNDVAGKPIRAWDSRAHSFRTEYDRLRRPLRSFVTGAEPANPNQELLTDRLVYGEQHPEAELRNLRGKLYLHLDQAGSVTTEAHDFKGNPLRASRRLTNGTQYRQAVDWRSVNANHVALPTDATALLDPVALGAALAPRLEAETYTSRTTYDALNRPVTLTTPHTPAMQPSVIRPGYNEANLLERVDVNLRGAAANAQPVWTPFVTNIDYDAKGQRQRIDYGNGASTFYDYDPLTFRLAHLKTARTTDGLVLQDLSYTYDPAGNITHIRDDAQQTIFFKNKRVEPSNDYAYDAVYRLIEATGREHLGQTNGAPNPPTSPDAFNAFHTRLDHPNERDTMGTYLDRYVYDAVGNFLQMQHRGCDPAHAGWTRAYDCLELSLIEDGSGGTLRKTSNRLTRTTLNPAGNTPQPETYLHDAHGNITRMPHLQELAWDFKDQLRMTRRQASTSGAAERTYYVYDGAGQRARKVTEDAQGRRVKERIYLGGIEIYREYDSGGIRLERETLHVMDDKQRIALVETKTRDNGAAVANPQPLTRYQLGTHLGSASLELDAAGGIISYEEYTPYGSTSYQAVRSQTETPKRYRYTGMERDEESGLNYHGARYYAAWVGRWASCDPLGIRATLNGLAYGKCNPLRYSDQTGNEDYEWPKGATFVSPNNNKFTGTLAHSDVLPEVESRINKSEFFTARTEVNTLPGGSSRPGSSSPGRMDMSVYGSTQGNLVTDLKPLGSNQNALRQTGKYSLYHPSSSSPGSPTVFSSKPMNRQLTDFAQNALDPVKVQDRTYLLSQSESARGRFDYYVYDKDVVKMPQVEHKPSLPAAGAAPVSSTAPALSAPSTSQAPAPAAASATGTSATTVVEPAVVPAETQVPKPTIAETPTPQIGGGLKAISSGLNTMLFRLSVITTVFQYSEFKQFRDDFKNKGWGTFGGSIMATPEATNDALSSLPPGTGVTIFDQQGNSFEGRAGRPIYGIDYL